jgi:hypothetical protein
VRRSYKKYYNLGTFWRNDVQPVLDGIMQSTNPNSDFSVNDETLGVIEIQVCFDAIETPYNCNKVKYYTENHTFKAGVNLLEAITNYLEVETSR